MQNKFKEYNFYFCRTYQLYHNGNSHSDEVIAEDAYSDANSVTDEQKPYAEAVHNCIRTTSDEVTMGCLILEDFDETDESARYIAELTGKSLPELYRKFNTLQKIYPDAVPGFQLFDDISGRPEFETDIEIDRDSIEDIISKINSRVK